MQVSSRDGKFRTQCRCLQFSAVIVAALKTNLDIMYMNESEESICKEKTIANRWEKLQSAYMRKWNK